MTPAFLFLAAMTAGQVFATENDGVTRYRPLEAWNRTAASPYLEWEAARRSRTLELAPKLTGQMTGLWSRDVQLLQDILLHKHGRLLNGSEAQARAILLRQGVSSMPQLRGIMAEATFIDRNPEWKLVKCATATQHDVYRFIPGRKAPATGQIKFHISGKASRYAADMRFDYRSERFFIPDDHVIELKSYLKTDAERLTRLGDSIGARRRWRDYHRVRPIGSTSKDIARSTRDAAESVAKERSSFYISLGAAAALSLGPSVWDVAAGNTTANIASQRALRSLSTLGVAMGTDFALQNIRTGALRGTVRGNLIVGSAIVITETLWLMHEHGWRQAFYRPEFYEQLGGGVSGIALGMAGGYLGAALFIETGPVGSAVAGGVFGFATGTIGYIGGRALTRSILDVVSPEMIQQDERQQIASVKAALEAQTQAAKAWPPASVASNSVSMRN